MLPISGDTSGFTLTNTCYVQRGGRDAIITYPDRYHRNFTMENCIVRCPPYNDKTAWGYRGYHVDGAIRRCSFINIPKEHGAYLSLGRGDLTFDEVLWMRCAAQGPQLRHSEQPPSQAPDWDFGRTVTFRKNVALECGQKRGAGRAAFVFSPKSPGPNTDLVFDQNYIRTIYQRDVDGKGHDSFGGICVELCRNVIGMSGYIEMRKPANPLIQFHDYGRSPKVQQYCPQGEITWDGLEAWGGTIALRVDFLGRVRFTNGKGDARFSLIKARPDGSGWYEWKSVPLTQGYSQG